MTSPTIDEFLASVHDIIVARVNQLASSLIDVDVSQMMPGKMLRARLAGRLVELGVSGSNWSDAAKLSAAIELAHTASLCHDDVIDNADTRRGLPAMWRMTGPSGAVLIGDLLLCAAIELVIETNDGKRLTEFLNKLKEVITAEAKGELMLRGSILDKPTCLEMARGKTGPLFAFVAAVCGGDDPAMSAALGEAGYLIGTAYQLADDLLDRIGDEDSAGKTLGTDQRRGKFTLACDDKEAQVRLNREVHDLCESAVKQLSNWDQAETAVRCYLAQDIQPLFQQLLNQDMIVRADSLT
ncbi:MAG: polyprenyl synthetase family protein [Phycisphaerae bacterium]|jgi:geranylgeranyl pyrophosphate synthase|nr:polyprenyl synthetase family protein [Phycisphaerae bacterium]MDP7286505.1 polyprenyl synthetase family protein [Phycisphaerae bacterium]